MIKVSIVVPAYNVERYIKRCIDSLIYQTYSNIQVIIVNDCSTDSSLSICLEYAEIDNRIEVVNLQHNRGLSEARNAGIEHAIGEYITFVDGDDYLELNAIEKCVEKILETEADEIVFSSFFDRINGKIFEMKIISSKKYYEGNKDMNLYFNEAIGALP